MNDNNKLIHIIIYLIIKYRVKKMLKDSRKRRNRINKLKYIRDNRRPCYFKELYFARKHNTWFKISNCNCCEHEYDIYDEGYKRYRNRATMMLHIKYRINLLRDCRKWYEFDAIPLHHILKDLRYNEEKEKKEKEKNVNSIEQGEKRWKLIKIQKMYYC